MHTYKDVPLLSWTWTFNTFRSPFTNACAVPLTLMQPTYCSGLILEPVMITMINVFILSHLLSLTERTDNCLLLILTFSKISECLDVQSKWQPKGLKIHHAVRAKMLLYFLSPCIFLCSVSFWNVSNTPQRNSWKRYKTNTFNCKWISSCICKWKVLGPTCSHFIQLC